MTRLALTLTLSLAIATVVAAIVAMAQLPTTPTVGAHTALISNDCRGWAIALGKQDRVRDSLHMHLLGCDDGPWTTMQYRATGLGDGCTAKARAVVRGNPEYYMYRPWTVARTVVAAMPYCTVYEDGSYEDNSTH
jgi:hypothetical protein